MERRVPQLDLSNCGPGFTDPAGVLPSLRCSAAFFTFLRANLVLTPSAVASPNLTPYLEPDSPCPAIDRAPRPSIRLSNPESQPAVFKSWATGAHSLDPIPPPPSPLASIDDIPPLSLDTLTSRHDRAEGLRLVADSVTEMRRRTQRILISHPLCLTALTAACALAARLGRALGAQSLPTLLVLPTIVALSYLAAVWLYTRGYIPLGETMAASCHHDIVLGARRGGSLVGVAVLRLESRRSPDLSASSSNWSTPPSSATSVSSASPRRKNRSRSSSLKGGRGVIRAWTTHPHVRGQGIGKQLLLAAVKKTRDKCGKDARVGFAQQHANSVVLLPATLAKCFRRDENRAAETLRTLAVEFDVSRRRKR